MKNLPRLISVDNHVVERYPHSEKVVGDLVTDDLDDDEIEMLLRRKAMVVYGVERYHFGIAS